MAITKNKARRILGKQGKALSDTQLEKLLGQFYGLAEIVANEVTRRGSNETTTRIEKLFQEGHNES